MNKNTFLSELSRKLRGLPKAEYDDAMNCFYESQVFDKLQDQETGLYLESPAYVYDLYKDEINFGKITQVEI